MYLLAELSFLLTKLCDRVLGPKKDESQKEAVQQRII